MGNSPRKEFGKWLSHAWKEAKEDRTENWTFLSAEREIKALGLALTCIENKDYCRPSDYIEAAALKARIDVIKYAGGVHA
ncbi:hypothetical protein [Methyloceanibacter caenitepidi]|uniref:Uncharacterized protein n=1 Tax=Methyloceanibacter caenitepidi TaxID=1384459 RepID=A0A0A8K5W6_9HYPH|nr:hypothetical protein [Methyloceanibacter caenitepidi]BAQ18310.1 hypothetical protein GL4_2877 [Methyloceanibacter caenitepidi]